MSKKLLVLLEKLPDHLQAADMSAEYVLCSLWCCNLSGGIALIVRFTTNGMCVKNNTIICVARASNSKRDRGAWSLLLLAAMVRSFARMPLGLSDRNSGTFFRRLQEITNDVECQWTNSDTKLVSDVTVQTGTGWPGEDPRYMENGGNFPLCPHVIHPAVNVFSMRQPHCEVIHVTIESFNELSTGTCCMALVSSVGKLGSDQCFKELCQETTWRTGYNLWFIQDGGEEEITTISGVFNHRC